MGLPYEAFTAKGLMKSSEVTDPRLPSIPNLSAPTEGYPIRVKAGLPVMSWGGDGL